MDSHEILRSLIATVGAKSVAADMNLSLSMIYRWCESAESEDASGARNPLDRVAELYRLTGEPALIEWLCRQADGFFVRNPPSGRDSCAPVLEATQKMLKKFSDLLQGVTDSISGDGQIDRAEAAKLRNEWEELKSVGETFIVACECEKYESKE